jgi:hypothetical protein
VRPYFTSHARQRLFERYGEQFTDEEEQAILDTLPAEIMDEAGTVELVAEATLVERPTPKFWTS